MTSFCRNSLSRNAELSDLGGGTKANLLEPNSADEKAKACCEEALKRRSGSALAVEIIIGKIVFVRKPRR